MSNFTFQFHDGTNVTNIHKYSTQNVCKMPHSRMYIGGETTILDRDKKKTRKGNVIEIR